MKRKGCNFLTGGGVFWIMLTSLFLFCSCRSEPISARERAIEANRLVREGKEDFVQGNVDPALQKFEKALQLAPDWKQARKDYAELLYFKGLSYSYESDQMWFHSLGKHFDEVTRTWRQSDAVVAPERRAELTKGAEEALNKAVMYFRRSLDQLQLLNRMLGGSDEDVICAMGFIHALLFEFDQAKSCFEHVLESPVVDEKVKGKIRTAISAINEFQKQQRSPSDR